MTKLFPYNMRVLKLTTITSTAASAKQNWIIIFPSFCCAAELKMVETEEDDTPGSRHFCVVNHAKSQTFRICIYIYRNQWYFYYQWPLSD